MKKCLLYIFVSLFSSLLILGCKQEEPHSFSNLIQQNQVYTIGIEGNELKTKGKIWFDESYQMHFLIEDPSSALFGMEEIVSENNLTVHFQDITWQSEEVSLPITEIFKAFQCIQNKEFQSKQDETINGISVESLFYEDDEKELKVIFSITKKENLPQKLELISHTGHYTINFSREM